MDSVPKDIKQNLLRFCKNGKLQEVKETVKQYPSIVNEHVDGFWGTALAIASRFNQQDIASFLLELSDIDVNKGEKAELTPLYLASLNGPKVLELLLKHPSLNINLKNEDKVNVLHNSLHTESLSLLLSHADIDVNNQNKNGMTPLHKACHRGEIKIVQLLLNHKNINTDIKNTSGKTPYDLAITSPSAKIIQDMLTKRKTLQHALGEPEGNWNRFNLLIAGQGRAGKTALANRLMGKPFIETDPTIGSEIFEMQIRYGNVHSGSYQLDEMQKPEKEFETVMASVAIERIFETTRSPSKTLQTTTISKTADANSIEPSPLVIEEKPNLNDMLNYQLCNKYLFKNISEQPTLQISLYDFGGQDIYSVLYPFFIRKYGVYIIVFDMELMMSKEEGKTASCMKYLRLWINLIAMHTYDEAAKNKVRVAIVGTRKDKVNKTEDHKKISEELENKFRSSLIWSKLIHYQWKGKRSWMGKTEEAAQLNFFPVTNYGWFRDETIQNLLTATMKIAEELVRLQEIPLIWIKALDEIRATNKSFLELKELQKIREVCKLHEDEVFKLLSFLNEIGILIWIDEEGLRETVILDPIEYFVKPVAKIFCIHIKSKDDPNIAMNTTEVHNKCKKENKEDWEIMLEYGIVSDTLARSLLLGYPNDHIETIFLLMERYGLSVPFSTVRQESDPNKSGLSAATAISNLVPKSEKHYFVSALLPDNPKNITCSDEKLIKRMTGRYELISKHFPTYLNFYFAFFVTLPKSSSLFTFDDIEELGFLPNGFYERLIALLLEDICSSSTVEEILRDNEFVSYKEITKMRYLKKKIRVSNVLGKNLIQVEIAEDEDFKNGNIVGYHDALYQKLQKLLREYYIKLKVITLIPFTKPVENGRVNAEFGRTNKCSENSFLITLSTVQSTVKNKQYIDFAAWNSEVSFPHYDYKLLEKNCRLWLEIESVHPNIDQYKNEPIEKTHDVFLSHDWGQDGANHQKVKAIGNVISETMIDGEKIKIWFDEYDNKGNMKDCIAMAIRQSRIFIVFLTSKYNDKIRSGDSSDYCYFEFNYASFILTMKKTIIVILDEEMKNNKNWTPRIQGEASQLVYLDFTAKDDINLLNEEIARILREDEMNRH